MKAYLDILSEIINTCHDWRENRTGIPDIGLGHGATFEHDMSLGFPLVTTKKMGLKNIATELEFFLRGITDKKWLTDRKCNIWNEWANPVRVEQVYNIAARGKNLSPEKIQTIAQQNCGPYARFGADLWVSMASLWGRIPMGCGAYQRQPDGQCQPGKAGR